MKILFDIVIIINVAIIFIAESWQHNKLAQYSFWVLVILLLSYFVLIVA